MTATTDVLEWGRERARTGPWGGDGRIAFLAPVPPCPAPSVEFVQRCLDTLAERGFAGVITAALSPPEQGAFLQLGFEEQEHLRLLAHDMRDIPRTNSEPSLHRADPAHRRAVLELDTDAFDAFWRLGTWGLDEALGATPNSRFRVALDGSGEVAGYAISGRSGRHGFLQRLAVRPSSRRMGTGTALVVDGLRWMRRHGVRRAVVNTQMGNEAAFGLYVGIGFRLQPAGLAVLRRALDR